MDYASLETRTADQPVLLLHCSASSGRQWDRLAGELGGGFRPVAPDLYGYGDTEPWTGPGGLSLAAEAALAASALPDETGAVQVVGHSYGGAVALRFAVEQPWRVKSLTLVEPVAFHTLREGGTGDGRLLDSVQRVAASVVKGIVTGDYHDAMDRFVDYWRPTTVWAPGAAWPIARSTWRRSGSAARWTSTRRRCAGPTAACSPERYRRG